MSGATTPVAQSEKDQTTTKATEKDKETAASEKAGGTEPSGHPNKPDNETAATEKAGETTDKAGGTEPAECPKKSHKVYGKFGLEDDEDQFERWEGPQRIKESKLTPAQTAKFLSHLERIFSKESLNGERIPFDPDDIIEVMYMVIAYLKTEPVLIEDVPFGITVVGDLYGHVHDLHRVFQAHAKEGKPGYECAKYLFLGSYVDKGQQSVEVVMALFCLKMLYPDNFFILRGNHEFYDINRKEGFFFELLDRYMPETAKALYWAVNQSFFYLSIAAVVGDLYFCVHGGISPRLCTRPMLRGVMKPFYHYHDDTLINDMIWADPAVGLNGTCFNQARGNSIFFDVSACVMALQNLGCQALIRGHSVVENGFDNLWFLCYTICSATALNKGFNDGAFVDINSIGKLHVKILKVHMQRAERDHRLYGLEMPKELKEKYKGKEKEEEEEKEPVTQYGGVTVVDDE